jgi:hypothetical protein
MTRVLLAAIGIAAMALAGMSLFCVPPGFPDGYISPYDQATMTAVTVGTYALLLFGIFTLVAAAMSKVGRGTIAAVLCVLLGAGLWLADTCPRMTWCTPMLEQIGLPIDDGQGG